VRRVSSVCVFCGSSAGVADDHGAAARELGAALARRGIRLVYGGGRIGLMGLVADAAIAAGGEVVGVIPRFLVDLEVAHLGLSDLRIVDTMHDRKRVMAELADAFLVLPGGLGTLEESVEIVTWRQLALHDKPIVFVSVRGFWEPFAALVDRFLEEGFAHPTHRGLFALAGSVDEALEQLATAEEPAVPIRVKRT
jgi:uncharacterized protein (TIGR00730 family)